jgi:NADH-quinone oxidoreductase subunit H
MGGYELSYDLALASVLLISSSLSLTDLANGQSGCGSASSPLVPCSLQPIGFLIFMTAGIAGANRAPFDLPEAGGLVPATAR